MMEKEDLITISKVGDLEEYKKIQSVIGMIQSLQYMGILGSVFLSIWIVYFLVYSKQLELSNPLLIVFFPMFVVMSMPLVGMVLVPLVGWVERRNNQYIRRFHTYLTDWEEKYPGLVNKKWLELNFKRDFLALKKASVFNVSEMGEIIQKKEDSQLLYKGYVGNITYIDFRTGMIHGELQLVKDVVTFKGNNIKNLKYQFERSVDDYLEFCKKNGAE